MRTTIRERDRVVYINIGLPIKLVEDHGHNGLIQGVEISDPSDFGNALRPFFIDCEELARKFNLSKNGGVLTGPDQLVPFQIIDRRAHVILGCAGTDQDTTY